MRGKERYIAWKSSCLPHGEMDFVSLVDEKCELRILLESFPPGDDGRRLEVRFESARAYRNIDEGYRLGQFGSFESEGESVIYTVENSTLLEEFHRQSFDTLRNVGLVHYLIVTVNDCVDVLSKAEPKVAW